MFNVIFERKPETLLHFDAFTEQNQCEWNQIGTKIIGSIQKGGGSANEMILALYYV